MFVRSLDAFPFVYFSGDEPEGGTLNNEEEVDPFDFDSDSSTEDPEEEDPEPDAGGEPGDTQDDSEDGRLPESVPYPRFKDVNDKNKNLERELERERQEKQAREQFISELLKKQSPETPPPQEEEDEWDYASATEERLHKEVKALRAEMSEAAKFFQAQQFKTIVDQADRQMKVIETEYGVTLTKEQKQEIFKDAFPFIQNGSPVDKQIERSYKYIHLDDIIKHKMENAEKHKVQKRKEEIGDRPSGGSPSGGVEEFDDLQKAIQAAMKKK